MICAPGRASDRPLLVLNTCQRLECYGFGEPADSDVAISRKHEHARAFERLAIRHAFAVVPMCDDLARQARRAARGPVLVLRDVSLLDPASGAAPACPPLAGIVRPCFLYVGNFEPYQGLGLLLESMARLSRTGVQASLLMASFSALRWVSRTR